MYLLDNIKRIIKLILFIIIVAVMVGVIVSFVFPLTYRDEINRYSEIYDLNPFLVAAMIKVESGYNKDAVSSKDAKGLMQIGPTTGEWAAEVLGVENYNSEMLFEPEVNIRFGTWYIRQLKSEFNENMALVLAAYNAGSGNVTNWLMDERYSSDGENLSYIPFEETRNYVEKVNFNQRAYSVIYRKFMEMPVDDSSSYFDIVITIRELLSRAYKALT